MKKIFVGLLFSSLLVFGSDGSASNTIESEEDKVVINNIPLSFNITIEGTNSRFISDLLDARVTVRNKDDVKHDLEYKFIWYDESGFEMAKHLSKWKRVRIDAKDRVIVKSFAVTTKIDAFKFYIRGIKVE